MDKTESQQPNDSKIVVLHGNNYTYECRNTRHENVAQGKKRVSEAPQRHQMLFKYSFIDGVKIPLK